MSFDGTNFGPDTPDSGGSNLLPRGWATLNAVAAACREALDAPPDLPMGGWAFLGLAAAIRSLRDAIPMAAAIALAVEEIARDAEAGSATDGATLLAMSRRRSHYLLYAAATEIGEAMRNGEVLDEVVLQIFGRWCLTRLVAPFMPSTPSIAKVAAALLRPDSRLAEGWSQKARARAFALALRDLDDAVERNTSGAREYGLVRVCARVEPSTDSTDVGNRHFRRRVHNLIDFSSHDAVGAAGGYGTLSETALINAGCELLARVKTGDVEALLVCLEAISHLTSEIALGLPLQTGDGPPPGALAWIDIRAGLLCMTLFLVSDRGARPPPRTGHLYEETSQLVKVRLSPPLHALLLQKLEEQPAMPATLLELLGAVGHHPRSAVVGTGIYRVTSRRLQESVPALLLQAGHHRWPVAMATNSHFLVARGRPPYGCCHASAIDSAVDAAYSLLGWPPATGPAAQGLVGSFTTPRAEAVTLAGTVLCDTADDASGLGDSVDGLVAELNAHAAWVAYIMALCLALRRWNCYRLLASELSDHDGVHVGDKKVHAEQSPPVPIAAFLRAAITAWYAFCADIAMRLRATGDIRGEVLAGLIEAKLADRRRNDSVFRVDAADRLEPVGSWTGVEALPTTLRLRANFARHFWPLRLMELGIEQLLIDLLLRHQLDGLHPGCTDLSRSRHAAVVRLLAAIERVLESLALRIPRALRRG